MQNLPNWDKTRKLIPDFVSAGKTRRSARRLLFIAGLTTPQNKEVQKVKTS